jgi:hypothetical protein
MDYVKEVYHNLSLDGNSKYQHINIIPDLSLSKICGQSFFEDGILSVLQDAKSFLSLGKIARQKIHEFDQINPSSSIPPFLYRYPCAYGISYIFLHLGIQQSISQIISLFSNPFDVTNTRVTFLEIKLRRLGFNYFLKTDYVAPRGSIGSSWPRDNQNKSGHIYFITKDGELRTIFPNPNNWWDTQNGNHEVNLTGPRWRIKDLAAENLDYFDHVYMPSRNVCTDGFWLPPGIYPLRREPSE